MPDNTPDLIVRHPTNEDAPAVNELMLRCGQADHGAADADMEDLLHDWGQIELSRDAWLITEPGGRLLAYASVLPWGPQDVRVEFYVAPEWQDEKLGAALIAQAETRAPAFNRDRGAQDLGLLRSFIAHSNARDRGTLLAAGYRPGRYYHNMQMELSNPFPPPRWPENVTLRTAVLGDDAQAIFEVVEAAFAREDGEQRRFEDWAAHMLRAESTDPELWFLAVASGEIVGVCLAFDYPSGGWVRQLGVLPHWQRQGIATALLRHCFQVFQERGVATVGLSVESKRPGAMTFYERAGMRVIRQYDEYVK